MPQFVRHEPHIRIDVAEKALVTRAQIIQSVLAFGGRHEAMFGALAVAGKAHIAFAAIGWQAGFFRVPKPCLLLRCNESGDRSFEDVSKPVLWVHEVIAGV